MIYVRVRCRRCRAVLAVFDSHPDDWTGRGAVGYCSRCAVPSPDKLVGVMLRRDVDQMPVLATFEWSWMRQHVEAARRRGRTVELVLSSP